MKSFWLAVSLVVLFGCVLENSKCVGSKKYNRYLAHLFNKYGSGGTMSFEGLEHLMHNLGLGGLEFSPTHTIEQHHPDGYKIPELIPEDEIQIVKEIPDDAPKNDTKKLSPVLPAQILEAENIDTEIDSNLTTQAGGESTFRELHDPKHRHPRHHADHNPLSANKCLSPLSLMKLVVDQEEAGNGKYSTSTQLRSKRHTVTNYANTENSNANNVEDEEEEEAYNQLVTSQDITPITFMKICPALLVQIDQDACAQPLVAPEEHHTEQDYIYAWIYASVSIFIISCCGLIGVAVVPMMKSVAYQEILQFLVAVAIGTLCGDALMHLLPHALSPGHGSVSEVHDHNEPVWMCACAFFTSLFMYTLETLLPLIRGSSGHNHSHAHHHTAPEAPKETGIDMEVLPKSDNTKEINIMLDEEKTDKKENSLSLTPVAFMVILGDGLHNLTDGLAIGAAFASEPVTGMATALAVLCHELPHELGDFALLLKTGVNINRAVFLNIVSSVLSFMGMAIGLIVAGMQSDMVRWIYAGTAGSFLYIALADLTPELGRDGMHDLKSCLIRILGIFLGGIIMLFIAFYEDSLKALFE